MTHNSITDQEFACEDCGFTSPLSDDACPNCGGRMTALDAPIKPKASGDGNTDMVDDPELTNADEDGGAISLESLQEQESRDDQQEDYGDGNE